MQIDLDELLTEIFSEDYQGHEHLTEMANIPTQKSNLEYCLYYSTNEHSAGPRLKVFNSTKCNKGKEIHIAISSEPYILSNTVNNLKYFKNKKDLKKILQMIIIFKNDLLMLWNEPETIVDTSDLQRNIIHWFNTNEYIELKTY